MPTTDPDKLRAKWARNKAAQRAKQAAQPQEAEEDSGAGFWEL